MLKLQYFGHLMQRADLLKKILMLGKRERETLLVVAVIVFLPSRPLTLMGNKHCKLSRENRVFFIFQNFF